MKIKLFEEKYIDDVFKIQQAAYEPIFEKYCDEQTNPYMETKEQILDKYTKGTNGHIT